MNLLLKESGSGYNLIYVPISRDGDNIRDLVFKEKCKWYEGKTLLEIIDELPVLPRDECEHVIIHILDTD